MLDSMDLNEQNEKEIKNYYGNEYIAGFDLIPREPFVLIPETNIIYENISYMIERKMQGAAWTVGLRVYF